VQVHLIDGTYELFRHFYAVPSRRDARGREIGAVRGVVRSVAGLLREEDVTHVGVATDHVVESFRNGLYAGYKTGAGIDPDLAAQFHPLEDALRALGVLVWPMVEFEADDALAAAAARAERSRDVERVLVCSPDKDLAQCVRGRRVVQFDRRQRILRDEDGVREKFGVGPESIPDYLALVGDAADGFPGLPRWGAKSAGAVLARYVHLERIPDDEDAWDVSLRGAAALAASLRAGRRDARLFRDLATLRTDIPVFDDVDELRWRGTSPAFPALCRELDLAGPAAELPPAFS
jgi:5'-3' exonuclease